MTINYGKREAGGLTAASPGDTLYIPFASYNDSGDSEALSGLAVTDIEIFKNGDVTPRATDSGYSILTDTGMYGNRPGAYRVRVQIYNTADDTGFFDAGGQYHVLIDSVTVDGKTVRFFPAIFEVGRQRVDVREFNDTGVNERLGRIQSDVDTGLRALITASKNELDTGIRDTLADYDTGIRDFITDAKNELDTGGVNVTATVDTGVINQAVWQANASRTITSLDVDTGLRDLIADIKVELDTGLRDFITDAKNELDTGGVNVTATVDTGVINQAVWQANASRTITSLDVDTGLRDLITDSKNELDTGIKAMLALADTGKIATAIWAGDTGLRDHIDNVDTGLTNRLSIIGFDVDTGLRAQLSDVDTGLHDAINDLDTGLRDYVDNTDTGLRVAITAAASDTGLTANLAAVRAKTDSLTFTVAGQVDANIQSVNDVTVTGTGASGNEWGP